MSGENSHRVPGGQGQGALAGAFPANIGLGPVGAVGMFWHEDFAQRDDTSGGFYGEKGWRLVSGTIASTSPTSVNGHEFGIRTLSTTSSINTNAAIDHNFGLFDTEIPIGGVLECKIRGSGSITNMYAWFGLQDASTTIAPLTGNNTDFVGFRYDWSSDPNWFGLLRNNTAEGTPLDTGVAFSNSQDEYARLGFERLNDGSYEFYSLTRSDDERVAPAKTIIGTIDANHPNESLRPVIGVRTSVASVRSVVVDYYTLCGRCRR